MMFLLAELPRIIQTKSSTVEVLQGEYPQQGIKVYQGKAYCVWRVGLPQAAREGQNFQKVSKTVLQTQNNINI